MTQLLKTDEKRLFEAALVRSDADIFLEGLNTNDTLRAVFPEVHAMVGFGGGDTGHKDLWGHTKQVVIQCVPKAVVRWAALYHDVGKVKCMVRSGRGEVSFHMHEAESARMFVRAASRLQYFTQPEIAEIRFLVYNVGHVEAYESNWTDTAVRRLSTLVGDAFDDITALARADITTKYKSTREKHHRRLKELRDRVEEIRRVDAIPAALPSGLGDRISAELGVPKSRELGLVLTALKALVEAGKLERQANADVHIAYIKDHPNDFPGVRL